MGACMSSQASTNGVLLVGLDGAGSTTILYELVEGKYLRTIPTLGSNRESIVFDGLPLEIYDIGGQEGLRPLWLRYLPEANAVIFVVDSSDESRIRSAGAEINKLFSRKKALRDVPLLIFANKQDLPNALSVEVIEKQLNVKRMPSPHVRIFPCSGRDKDTLSEGMTWLTRQLSERRALA